MAIDPLLFKYKGNCCANCGLTVEEMMRRFGVINKIFQFHHVDQSKKHPNYDNLIQRVISFEQLDEIDKCILLCNICHDILHAQRADLTLILTIYIDDRTIDQQVSGQTIFDRESNSLTFFTDDHILIYPYVVRRGELKPYLLTGLELNDGRLLEFLIETRENGQLTISSHDRMVMVQGKESDEDESVCSIMYNTEFPLFTFGQRNEDGSFKLSIRKGQTIYNPRDIPSENPSSAIRMVTIDILYDELVSKLKAMHEKK